jgi:hypothetical protein
MNPFIGKKKPHTHNAESFHSYACIKVHFKRKLLSDGFQFPTQGHIVIFTLFPSVPHLFQTNVGSYNTKEYKSATTVLKSLIKHGP